MISTSAAADDEGIDEEDYLPFSPLAETDIPWYNNSSKLGRPAPPTSFDDDDDYDPPGPELTQLATANRTWKF